MAGLPPVDSWWPKGAIAVLDTSTLVRARLSPEGEPNPSRLLMLLAGHAYDSFTSPAILGEVEQVLSRPRFGIPESETRIWLDHFVRMSRQLDATVIPGDYAAALGDDEKDNPILKTALAVNLHDEGQEAIAFAAAKLGCFIVSTDQDFAEGRTSWGWKFVRPHTFLALLRSGSPGTLRAGS